MAEKKPKAKVATKTQAPTSISLQKIQPFNYDAVAFKNSQIDAIKGKMKAFTDEWTDIVDPKDAGFPMPEKSNRMASRYVGAGLDRMPDVSKRNYLIDKTFNVTGPVTGKKGVSKSALKENFKDMMRYRKDEKADYLKSSGDYIDSIASAKENQRVKILGEKNVAKFDSTVKAQGGKWDPKGGWPEGKKITRDINPSAISKMKPLPTAKTIRGKKK